MDPAFREGNLQGNGSHPIHTLLDEAQLHLDAGEARNAISVARQAMEVARGAGRRDAEAVAGFLLGKALVSVGKRQEALEPLRRAETILRSAGAAAELAAVRALLKRAESPEADPSTPDGRLAAAFAALKDSRPEEALAVLDAMPEALTPRLSLRVAVVRAQAYGELHRFDEALRQMREAFAQLPPDGPSGDRARLESLQEQLRLSRDLHLLANTPTEFILKTEPTSESRAERLAKKGLAEIHSGRLAEGTEAFEAAEREAEASGSVKVQFETRCAYILALVKANQPESARALLRGARSLADDLGGEARRKVEEIAQSLPPAAD